MAARIYSMKKALAVHGVGLKKNLVYAHDWSIALGASSGVIFTEGRWDSTGNFATDIRLTLTDKDWREAQIDFVESAIRGAIEDEKCSMIVAHSMGTVFVAEALRRYRTDVPVVFLGSPLNHPVWKNGLRTVGLAKPTPNTPHNFWNNDDLVASARVIGARPPQWCVNQRIAVAGHQGRVVEHNVALYLQNGLVAQTIAKLAMDGEQP